MNQFTKIMNEILNVEDIKTHEKLDILTSHTVKNLITSYPAVVKPNESRTFDLVDLDVKELVISVRQHGISGFWELSATAQTKDPNTIGGTGILEMPIVEQSSGSEYGVSYIILPVIFKDMRISIKNKTGIATSLSVAIMGRY